MTTPTPAKNTATPHPPLTQFAVLALAAIVLAARDGVRVARLMPDGHPLAGEVVHGTARHLVINDSMIFPGVGDDIRDTYLRVTGGISEYVWPVAELVTEYQNGTFSTTVD